MKIGIDLGTNVISAFIGGKNTIISEPSVAAVDTYTGKIVSVGTQALNMTGRAPDSFTVFRPVRDGVIFNYDITVSMLQMFIDKICGNSILKPDVMVSTSCTMTSVEKMALLDAFASAGSGRICLIEEPMAAALGAEIEMKEPKGTMLVDFGGGSLDIAVVTMGDIAVSKSFKNGSDYITADIVKYLKRERDIDIGELTAESIKHKIGGAHNRSEEVALVANGKNSISGSPISFEITSTEVYYAIHDRVVTVADDVVSVLNETPAELSADIFSTGIVLTGNGSRLYGLEKYISDKTGVGVRLADDPGFCVAKGLGKALKDIGYLRTNGYFLNQEKVIDFR